MATSPTAIKDKISARLVELLQPFGLQPQITMATEDDTLIVDVKTGQDELFISHSPDPLLALQHLLRLMVRNDFPDQTINLSLNIGGFHELQRERLLKVARDAAAQTEATGTAVYLPPMSSFERRLIHLALVDNPKVTSESTGVGPGRRVVVKPA
ncbi:TPA: hypothetical protein DHW58_01935 [Patescibacteria group bacterium]|uniref:RNA-binding protein n=2 Tax=Bacteria division Kazan-3B-28 TaxID=1798534 RepID=A0A0G1X897_UNCK3|nr:MAG: jag, R3H domain-containing protein, spoIIIJ-associated protein [candidate division Kazan bacterium GW2011_GWA1_50_15]KKW25774.1 MAG: RNA-binding protein [candidate division Kazan bacterium GW2011_GWC1_52_13]KKW27211.1 MAG: RNA-binding protein [candidate division Kazan bacterium GW2011_GWB1_52_7]HCL47731.1 hypothetical protein [Patescibacteria group bacterium]HCR42502.1 hypothetical protein [Patescibacteria group bacterium]